MGVVRRTVSPHAAPLRREATDAERALWAELRARRLGGHKFRRQWTLGRYIVDFCCVEHDLVVETDGYDGPPNGRVRDVPDRRTIRYYTTIGLLDRPAEVSGCHGR